MDLVAAHAVVTTVSSVEHRTFAIRRERSGSAVDMLSTNITIDANEKTSYTAVTAPVINTSNDDVATGDIIYVDLDTVGTGAKGHAVVADIQVAVMNTWIEDFQDKTDLNKYPFLADAAG